MIRVLFFLVCALGSARALCRAPLRACRPPARCDCHYLPPSHVVPAELVYGTVGDTLADGTVEGLAVFDWTKAAHDYIYRVVERLPADAATDETLGVRAGRNRTTLARYTHPPDQLGVDAYRHYRITVEAASVCAPAVAITHATYFIDLVKTFQLTQNFTSAHARFTACGWITEPTLVMHPDVHYETAINLTRSRTEHVVVRSQLYVEQDGNNTCQGIGAELGTPCYGVMNISITREGWTTDALSVTYALSQFAQMSPTARESEVLPYNFDATRQAPVLWNRDYRYDVCEARITSNGVDYEKARSPLVEQWHTATQDLVVATCRYRIFFAEETESPFAYLVGWADYGAGGFLNHSRIGSTHQAFTITE